MTVLHIIDRRLNPSGKSLSNRQKFLKRSKEEVRRAVRKATESGSIEDVLKGGSISIPTGGIGEPRLHRGGSGKHDQVLPGNKKFVEGDVLPRPRGGEGQSGREAGEGDSEDAFRFVLSREEFLEIFLGDLELPDLVKRKLVETESEGLKRAGYSVSGSPANIAIARTAKLALQRRTALRRPTKKEIEEQRELVREAGLKDDDEGMWGQEQFRLERLMRRAKRVPYIDTNDVRYRRFEPQPKPNSQAVMFCLMDVSGSMSEHMKDLAKRFYMLLYVFLVKCYGPGRVQLVFIRHTDHAKEVDEETFFRDRESGGTRISPALELMHKIVKERYAQSDWNIYAAQASDGDNDFSDNIKTAEFMTSSILPLSQFFAYLEVDEERDAASMRTTGLWDAYQKIKSSKVPFATHRVTQRSQIYPVFRELFKKRMPGEVV